MASELPILVAGAGPVGLIAAYTLAHHRIRCVLIERNDSTTKWPKMDITNVRSMEILRRLGLAEQLREQGTDKPFNRYTSLTQVSLRSQSRLFVRRYHQFWPWGQRARNNALG